MPALEKSINKIFGISNALKNVSLDGEWSVQGFHGLGLLLEDIAEELAAGQDRLDLTGTNERAVN